MSALSDAAQDNVKSTVAKAEPRDPAALLEPAVDATRSKYDIGTKDAPVDGKDGKPHAGPWVGTEDKKPKSKPKSEAADGELVTKSGSKDEAKLVAPDGTEIPQVNDGVMDDPNRQVAKQGTTGTEGGVSEKDKARKAQEGQTGEKVGKTPDPPKQAHPLPPNTGEKSSPESGRSKSKSKDEDDDDDSAERLGGLEVCTHHSVLNTFSDVLCRNPTTSRKSSATNHTPFQAQQRKTTSISQRPNRRGALRST